MVYICNIYLYFILYMFNCTSGTIIMHSKKYFKKTTLSSHSIYSSVFCFFFYCFPGNLSPGHPTRFFIPCLYHHVTLASSLRTLGTVSSFCPHKLITLQLISLYKSFPLYYLSAKSTRPRILYLTISAAYIKTTRGGTERDVREKSGREA